MPCLVYAQLVTSQRQSGISNPVLLLCSVVYDDYSSERLSWIELARVPSANG
jgi:hypothetical protein